MSKRGSHAFVERFGKGAPALRLACSRVEGERNRGKACSAVGAQVGAFRELLPRFFFRKSRYVLDVCGGGAFVFAGPSGELKDCKGDLVLGGVWDSTIGWHLFAVAGVGRGPFLGGIEFVGGQRLAPSVNWSGISVRRAGSGHTRWEAERSWPASSTAMAR